MDAGGSVRPGYVVIAEARVAYSRLHGHKF